MAALLLCGCGSTQIIASDPQARIWVDGEFVGRGHGEIRKVGFPGSAHVMAKTDDGRSAVQPMRRSFGWTALLGFVTYGACFIACWEYPNALYVELPAPALAPTGGPEPTAADPWLVPAPGWKNPAPVAPEPPATAPSPEPAPDPALPTIELGDGPNRTSTLGPP